MRPTPLATGLAAAAAVVPLMLVTPAEAAGTSCSFTRGTGLVTVTITGVEAATSLRRADDDRLLVGADLCLAGDGTPADMTNVRTIRVRSGAGDQDLDIVLGVGRLGPGAGDEAGSSDEIEIDIDLGSGLDTVAVLATDAPLDVRAGSSGGVHLLNLNAGEQSGVDADVTIRGVERIHLSGGPAGDRMLATGGLGTGSVLALSVLVADHAGGDDLLVGGRGDDDITDSANGDTDTLRGGPGEDYLYAADGDLTADSLSGGPGADVCATDAVDVVASCQLLPSSS